MKLQAAIKQGTKKAEFLGEEVFIILEKGEYRWATSYDISTFYSGSTIVYNIFPDGSVILRT
jgi:hypothetical protein